jgi:hypothetical protein
VRRDGKMDGTPWRVKLIAKPIMAVMVALNPQQPHRAGSDVGVDRRPGGRGVVFHAWGREENECGETFVPDGDQHVLKGCRGGEVDERGPSQCAPGIRERGEGDPPRAAAACHRQRQAAVGAVPT